MKREHTNNPWARYADDGVIHCRTKEEAEKILSSLKERLEEVGLEIHPEKTQIVYCKDDDRRGSHTNTSFDFLSYTFRPRLVKSRNGEFFVSFTPAVSNKASKAMRQAIRRWKLQFKTDVEITDLAKIYNTKIRGWINYYGAFNKSAMNPVLKHINKALQKWGKRKYKKLKRSNKKARKWLRRTATDMPGLFVHWQMGIIND